MWRDVREWIQSIIRLFFGWIVRAIFRTFIRRPVIGNSIVWAASIFWRIGQEYRHCAGELVAKLRLPSGRLPDSYQVVVRARFKDQMPIETSYVTHRVLQTRGGA